MAWEIVGEVCNDVQPEELEELITSHRRELNEELETISKVSEEEGSEEEKRW